MKTDVKIRMASDSEADLDALIRLATAFRDHLGQSLPSDADFRQSLALLLKDAGTEFFLACDALGATPGYVQARHRYSTWTSALEAELEEVFVVHEARRHGVGLRLLEFVMARAIDRGCRSIGLNTNGRNTGALALCRKCGFAAERARGGMEAGSFGC